VECRLKRVDLLKNGMEFTLRSILANKPHNTDIDYYEGYDPVFHITLKSQKVPRNPSGERGLWTQGSDIPGDGSACRILPVEENDLPNNPGPIIIPNANIVFEIEKYDRESSEFYFMVSGIAYMVNVEIEENSFLLKRAPFECGYDFNTLKKLSMKEITEMLFIELINGMFDDGTL